jgi:RNA polymerase sigma-70 factor (ECF subfamily)
MAKPPAACREDDLLADLMRGDSEAFSRLFIAYYERLVTAVTGIVRCRADAEDVVQDAFIQAYIKLDSFQAKSTFFTWIYRIAVNNALSHNRRHRLKASLETKREIAGDELEDAIGPPSERMMRAEHAARIKNAFGSLRHDYRAILMLRGVEGHDYDTIARMLGLKPGTVRSRLHRARTELREELDDAAYCHA